MTTDPVFTSAAMAFAQLVHQVPAGAWDGPGLGEWDLRALVGHTSRSLITVSTYLATSAEHADVPDPQSYYKLVRDVASTIGPAAVAERGRQAGRDLGADPAAAVNALVERALTDVAAAQNPLIEVIGGLGIRLHTYLPTRTFELAVHSLDIARAAGIAFSLPCDVLCVVTPLAARIAVALGDGESVLSAPTGRTQLPPSFSVV